MKWSSQPRPDGHGHSAGDHDHHVWMAPAEEHPAVGGDADHRVRASNHESSHISLRTVDAAHRFLKSIGYIR